MVKLALDETECARSIFLNSDNGKNRVFHFWEPLEAVEPNSKEARNLSSCALREIPIEVSEDQSPGNTNTHKL